MVELRVTLPDWAGQYIEEQVANGAYGSGDELLVELIDRARVMVASDRLAALIREGMESGEGVEMTDEYWDQFDERISAELQKRRIA